MIRSIFTFLCIIAMSSSWSQRRIINYGLTINDQQADLVLLKNFRNILEITCEDGPDIRIKTAQARVQKIEGVYVIIPNKGEREVMIEFIYCKRKKESRLGMMIFKVQ